MFWKYTMWIGAGFVVLGLALAVREYRFVRRARIGDGTVVEVIKSRGYRAQSRTPRVRFRAADGSEHEFTRMYATYPMGFAPGQRVLVAYDPQTYEGRILTFGQRFGFAVIFACIGLAIVAMSACFLWGDSLFSRLYQQPPPAIAEDPSARAH